MVNDLSTDEQVLHILEIQRGHIKLTANEKKAPLLANWIEHYAMRHLKDEQELLLKLSQGEFCIVALLGSEVPQSYKSLEEYYHIRLTLQIDKKILTVISEVTDHHVFGPKIEAIELIYDNALLDNNSDNLPAVTLFKALVTEKLLHFGDLKADNDAPLTSESWKTIKQITLADEKAVMIINALRHSEN